MGVVFRILCGKLCLIVGHGKRVVLYMARCSRVVPLQGLHAARYYGFSTPTGKLATLSAEKYGTVSGVSSGHSHQI